MINTAQEGGTRQGLDVLRQFARRPRPNAEHCEMCASELHREHPHLIELTQRKLLCACEACAMLFSSRSDSTPPFLKIGDVSVIGHGKPAPRAARYKRVPRDVRFLANFHMSDAAWDGLLIPINLAFFFRKSALPSGPDSCVSAFYPSPAGATESLLPLEAWNSIVQTNPILSALEPDVEALLVNRVGAARGATAPEYYIVPIDACYKLVGLIRMHWRGLSGGTEVWQEIGAFFSQLRGRAEVVGEEIHA
ncbi:MAG: DUF5947 family protein [Terriglobales bacterium]|jgi:hypothetical protein